MIAVSPCCGRRTTRGGSLVGQWLGQPGMGREALEKRKTSSCPDFLTLALSPTVLGSPTHLLSVVVAVLSPQGVSACSSFCLTSLLLPLVPRLMPTLGAPGPLSSTFLQNHGCPCPCCWQAQCPCAHTSSHVSSDVREENLGTLSSQVAGFCSLTLLSLLPTWLPLACVLARAYGNGKGPHPAPAAGSGWPCQALAQVQTFSSHFLIWVSPRPSELRV